MFEVPGSVQTGSIIKGLDGHKGRKRHPPFEARNLGGGRFKGSTLTAVFLQFSRNEGSLKERTPAGGIGRELKHRPSI